MERALHLLVAIKQFKYGKPQMVNTYIPILVTQAMCIPWPGLLMVSSLLQLAVMGLSRFGFRRMATFCILCGYITRPCGQWPGPRMANVLLQGATTIPFRSGMPPMEVMSSSWVVIPILYTAWRGLLMASILPLPVATRP